MDYNFREIEKKWQQHWKETGVYKVSNQSDKPKYYVLDMFPYPSGAGLHVGHPLGYIASDIFARFKRLKGYNVLHPMGYDAFGLPAEQYAIEHGIHPAVSTKQNIENFRNQLDKIGFSYDWSREVNTSNPTYYKWTQWIFLQLFNSWYNRKNNKAEPIEKLIKNFEAEGNKTVNYYSASNVFTSNEWKAFDEKQQQGILMQYRLAYCGIGEVNWCEALGTVLANDEVINGVSERGGYPVVKKKLRQWYLRITEYADRLLEGLQHVDFSDAMKDMQTNWIGKSIGAEIDFPLTPASPRWGEDPKKEENKKTKEEQFKMPGNGYAEYSVDSAMSFENAKNMRKEPTQAENVLWEALRNKNIGFKFRRQHPVENYIADFICLDVWIIIEIDGGYHASDEQKKADDARDSYLKETGFTTLRFTNEQVLNNLDHVLNQIKETCENIKKISIKKRTTIYHSTKGSSPLQGEAGVRVYTTRPDTIFGVDFIVLAPEHDLVEKIISVEQKIAVEEYLSHVKSRNERERMAEKNITGVFTGAYAINPFNDREIPVWISEYVLANYGTGAIMAVPCGDERDFKFAKHFNIPITNIIGEHFNGDEANPTKDAILTNSDFLNGILMRDAIEIVVGQFEVAGIGKRKINYKMRDAAFSRQRYWGEPIPIVWKDGIAYPLNENELPLELPYVENYKPGPDGEGPLANIQEWTQVPLSMHGEGLGVRETNTMPGYAGSSWYFLRYMDPHNDKEFCNRKVSDYWNQVDLYIGGTEHAVGHLLYSRMWTKALCDLGFIGFDEPYKRLMNQGMIQGSSRYMYKVVKWNYSMAYVLITGNIIENPPVFISYNYIAKFFDGEKLNKEGRELCKKYTSKIPSFEIFNYEGASIEYGKIHANVNIVDGVELDIEAFKKSKAEYANAEFILEEDGKYICGVEVEKMSKSKYNTVNPDDLINKYGADTFRMYEMFLGPVEQSKPWDTKGIEGVHRFLRKLWRLFFDETKGKIWTEENATDAELKVLHKTIKKIEEDTERFSFNTAVSAFMVCVNELSDLKCNKREVLEPLLILLSPYAPHIAEELYQQIRKVLPCGEDLGGVITSTFPTFEEKYIAESTKEYPVSINGKLRTTIKIDLSASQEEVQQIVLANDIVKKWVEDNPIKKFIFVKNKMINLVI